MFPKSPQKKRKPAPYIFLIILAAFLGIYFRLYPATHNQRLLDTNRARLAAYVNINKYLQKQVEDGYPGLPEARRNALQEKFFAEAMSNDKKHVDDLIKKIAAQNRSNPFEETYLLEADPYYYLGLTENILKKGDIGGERRGIKYFNPLMTAPNGHWYYFDLHPYAGFYIFKLLDLIKKGITPELSAAMTPIILFVPAVIMAFWLCSSLRLRPASIWFGLIYFACLPIFIVRDSFGWYDTDIYNVIFPLLVITLLVRSLCSGATFRRAVGLNLTAAFFTALYSLFWQGWLYLPFFVSAAYVAVIFFNFSRKAGERNRPLAVCFAAYAGAGIFFTVLFIGITGVGEVFSESLRVILSFFGAEAQIWPDIYVTIGELRAASFLKAIGLLGGAFAVLLVLFGFLHQIALIFARKQGVKEEQKTVFLCAAGVFLFIFSITAERFLLFCSVPFMIFFAFGVEAVFGMTNILKNKKPSWSVKKYLAGGLAVLFCVLMLPELMLAHSLSSRQFPIMNRCWKEVLLAIGASTPPEAIVNSLWCPGHFITAISKRRVTFDGATASAPLCYWTANAFLSADEERSMGIWRMLNTGSNAAFDYLTEKKKLKPSEAVRTLNSILPLDRQKATALLSDRMPREEADLLLRLTHDSRAPSYCLVYNNMIETIIALEYFGNWDLKKIEDLNELRRFIKQKTAIDAKRGSPEYKDFIWSISGGEGYMGEESCEVRREGATVFFGNGAALNTKDMDCSIYPPGKNITVRPSSVFYMEEGVFKEKKLDNPTAKLSVLFIKSSEKFSCVIADRQLASSLLLRLYYLKGEGLKYFRNFYSAEDPLTRTRICVYKMEWDEFNNRDQKADNREQTTEDRE